MIYDLIPYCGEENILEIRLHELNEIVDKFIILEGVRSHTGIYKQCEFNISDFPGFENKIEYLSYDYCIHTNPFYNDEQGRLVLYNMVKSRLGLRCFVLHGDLDEIPNKNVLQEQINSYSGPATLLMKNRVLCLDLEQPNIKFPGTMILKRQDIDKVGLNNLRNNRQNSHYPFFKLVENAGWHFTYNMGLEKTLNKLKYFAHAPETGSWCKNKEELITCIKQNISVDKQTKLVQIPFAKDNFPEYILDNPQKYQENLSFNY